MQPQKSTQSITDVQPPSSATSTKPVPAPQEVPANTTETPQHLLMEQSVKVEKPEKPHTSPRQHSNVPVAAIVLTLLVTTALAAIAVTMYFQQKHQTTTTNTSNNY